MKSHSLYLTVVKLSYQLKINSDVTFQKHERNTRSVSLLVMGRGRKGRYMLSIGEILRSECFRGAELITDIEPDVPVVGSVTVGEVPDIAQWLTGGEMVLTTLFTARDAGGKKFEMVENIINSQAGALVVKLGRFVENLPGDIIELANERCFPIITLPAEVRWTNVIMDVSRLLSQRDIELLGVRASFDTEMRLMGNLFALLNSGSLSRQQAISRASFLQIDLTGGFIVCVVDLVRVAGEDGSRTIEKIMERAYGMAKRIISAYFPGPLIALDGKRLNILLVPPVDIEQARRSALVGSTMEKVVRGLNDIMPEVEFRVGASSFHGNPAEVNIAYNEAITAALISLATGRAGVGNYRDLGLYKLLLIINRSHPDEAVKFCAETLGAIEEYDQKREGGLMHTLEVFFASSENISDTAAKLFTHRHTVRYRLQRIAELSGFDPFDPDDREVLRIAVKLRQLIKFTDER